MATCEQTDSHGVEFSIIISSIINGIIISIISSSMINIMLPSSILLVSGALVHAVVCGPLLLAAGFAPCPAPCLLALRVPMHPRPARPPRLRRPRPWRPPPCRRRLRPAPRRCPGLRYTKHRDRGEGEKEARLTSR